MEYWNDGLMKKAPATHLIRLEISNCALCDCDLALMQLVKNKHSNFPSFHRAIIPPLLFQFACSPQILRK
jgi:hypothetical protein